MHTTCKARSTHRDSLADVGAQAKQADAAHDGANVVQNEVPDHAGRCGVEHEPDEPAQARPDPHVHRRPAQVLLCWVKAGGKGRGRGRGKGRGKARDMARVEDSPARCRGQRARHAVRKGLAVRGTGGCGRRRAGTHTSTCSPL